MNNDQANDNKRKSDTERFRNNLPESYTVEAGSGMTLRGGGDCFAPRNDEKLSNLKLLLFDSSLVARFHTEFS